jgi:hypothetical protein
MSTFLSRVLGKLRGTRQSPIPSPAIKGNSTTSRTGNCLGCGRDASKLHMQKLFLTRGGSSIQWKDEICIDCCTFIDQHVVLDRDAGETNESFEKRFRRAITRAIDERIRTMTKLAPG